MRLPFRSLPLVWCRAVCAACCRPDPHPQHGFKPNIFFLFFRAEPASPVSSRWVMRGRQREQVSMATDVYRAPEMRHRVGERHFSIWDGVPGSCHPPAPREGQGPGLWDGGVSCSLSPKPQPGGGIPGCFLQREVWLRTRALRSQGAPAPLWRGDRRGGTSRHRFRVAVGSGTAGLGVCCELCHGHILRLSRMHQGLMPPPELPGADSGLQTGYSPECCYGIAQPGPVLPASVELGGT